MKYRIVGFVMALAVLSGCASTSSKKSLENVAKSWCETIRASQIMCAYPMTEDLVPGDVFLVQTTIEEQSDLYREHGFLALDDHQVRLHADYRSQYSDGYFKDNYGAVPHPLPGSSGGAQNGVDAPHVAFPSYSFDASGGSGASLALPISGIPLGLGFLHAEKVTGNVILSSAYTYAADTGSLYSALRNWANQNRDKLGMTLRQSKMDYLFLRVVSRVYLVEGVSVTLSKLSQSAHQATVAGTDAPEVSAAAGAAMAARLNEQTEAFRSALPGSAGLKFLSASDSSVSLVESFDKPLVVGYVGFDVPVFKGGVIGVPIPVFERLEGRQVGQQLPINTVSGDIASYKLQKYALRALTANNPAEALAVAKTVAEKLDSPEFKNALHSIGNAATDAGQAGAAVADFMRSADNYVSAEGPTGPRYAQFGEVFSAAFDQRDIPSQRIK